MYIRRRQQLEGFQIRVASSLSFLSFLTPFIPWRGAAATWYDDYDGGDRRFIFQKKKSKENQEEDANVSGV